MDDSYPFQPAQEALSLIQDAGLTPPAPTFFNVLSVAEVFHAEVKRLQNHLEDPSEALQERILEERGIPAKLRDLRADIARLEADNTRLTEENHRLREGYQPERVREQVGLARTVTRLQNERNEEHRHAISEAYDSLGRVEARLREAINVLEHYAHGGNGMEKARLFLGIESSSTSHEPQLST